jgi:hypothetical protein
MNMKRFLILFTLIAFVTVSCAGPNKANKVRWTKPDFRQDEFEKDLKECMETANKEESYSRTSGVFDHCMFKKGYESESKTPSDKEKSKTAETSKTVGKVLLVTGLVVVLVAAVGACVVLAALGSGNSKK